ncbi:hypothetical protein WI26_23055 [Burkholderia diffusa]|nr:hypothetical protein WI26_23055 [Burkholderia diffusa]
MRFATRYVDLLCFLVAMQLVTKRKTREWLSPFQLVESLQAWLVVHRAKCEWRDRVWIGHASLQIAKSVSSVDKTACAEQFLGMEDGSPIRPRSAFANRLSLRSKCIHYLREHV